MTSAATPRCKRVEFGSGLSLTNPQQECLCTVDIHDPQWCFDDDLCPNHKEFGNCPKGKCIWIGTDDERAKDKNIVAHLCNVRNGENQEWVGNPTVDLGCRCIKKKKKSKIHKAMLTNDADEYAYYESGYEGSGYEGSGHSYYDRINYPINNNMNTDAVLYAMLIVMTMIAVTICCLICGVISGFIGYQFGRKQNKNETSSINSYETI